MEMVPRVVGDFKSSQDWTIEYVKTNVENILKNLDVDDFLADVELGNKNEDDIVIIYYDYLDGGVGSTYVFLSIDKDEDGGGELILTSYGVASEYSGNVTYDGYISMGDEETLLEALYDTLLFNTDNFKNN